MITFLRQGRRQDHAKFIDALELFLITPSLGGSESLVTQMCDDVVLRLPRGIPRIIGMVDNLVRLALGLEDVDDLIADLEQALEKV